MSTTRGVHGRKSRRDMSALPSLSIIIVNYNTADLLPACLDSVMAQSDQWQRLFVVDNNSTDDSVAVIKQRYPLVELIDNHENVGFGTANNQAAEKCESDLLFLLNPDTVLHPKCLVNMREYMHHHGRVGLGGIKMINYHGQVHDTIEHDYPGEHYSKRLFATLPGSIAWVLGAGMVVRKEVMNSVNGFDEHFFLYGEDIDLCLRIRRAGWEIGFIEEAAITHLEGQSERNVAPLSVFEKKMKAQVQFLTKHYPINVQRKIGRARLIQAVWRIFCLSCLPASPEHKLRNQMKLEQYRIALRLYRSII